MDAVPTLATLLVLAGLAPAEAERVPAEVATSRAFHGRHGTGKKGIG
jgi:hypothetical protein